MRKDGRQENELRPITMIRDFTDTKGGSVLISWGNTRVLCTALLEEGKGRQHRPAHHQRR